MPCLPITTSAFTNMLTLNLQLVKPRRSPAARRGLRCPSEQSVVSHVLHRRWTIFTEVIRGSLADLKSTFKTCCWYMAKDRASSNALHNFEDRTGLLIASIFLWLAPTCSAHCRMIIHLPIQFVVSPAGICDVPSVQSKCASMNDFASGRRLD